MSIIDRINERGVMFLSTESEGARTDSLKRNESFGRKPKVFFSFASIRFSVFVASLLLILLLSIAVGADDSATSPGSSGQESLDLSALEQVENEAKASAPAAGSSAAVSPDAGKTPEPAAQTEQGPPASTGESKRPGGVHTLWELILAGGWIGAVIFVLSLVACTLVIQFCFVFRRKELMPMEVCREVERLIETGRIRQAALQCENDDSSFARVIRAGLAQVEFGWDSVERAVEDALAEESAAMYRRVEHLSVIGNITPMLGLLGTVLGMVIAFGELATSDGLGRNLAQGIYFALVTTVDGLLVAIPSLLAFSYFNNRVAALTTELTHCVEIVLRPLRKVASSSGNVPGTSGGKPPVATVKTGEIGLREL